MDIQHKNFCSPSGPLSSWLKSVVYAHFLAFTILLLYSRIGYLLSLSVPEALRMPMPTLYMLWTKLSKKDLEIKKFNFKIYTTLKVESFAGRNFSDFANFLVVCESLYPRNLNFQVVRESLYPRNFRKFLKN